MIYLTIPMAVWGLTLALMQYARGQRGFDLFFRHFSILCGVAVLGAVLYLSEMTQAGFLVFAGWVSAHSLGLLLYALFVAGIRLRRSSAATLGRGRGL